jgi:chromosome segregation ATPase
MRWLLTVLGALALVATTAAEDQTSPQTAVILKKQIANVESLIAKKKAEITKAEATFKTLNGEAQAARKVALDKLKEMQEAAEKGLNPVKEKAVEASKAVEAASRATEAAGHARDDVSAKLKTATDQGEIGKLRKQLADLEAAFKDKTVAFEKVRTAAKAADEEYKIASETAKVALRKAVRDMEDAAKGTTQELAKGRFTLSDLQDELQQMSRTLHKLQQALMELKK